MSRAELEALRLRVVELGGYRISGPPLNTVAFLAFDLETTGPKPDRDNIVQIGMLFQGEAKPDGTKGDVRTGSWYVNPGVPIPDGASNVHGIYDKDVSECPMWFERADKKRDVFARYEILVGFNLLRFDIPLINREFEDAGVKPLDHTAIIDPYQWVLWAAPYASLSLGKVCEEFGIELTNAHDALGDVLATVELMHKLVELGHMPDNVPAICAVQDEIFAFHVAERELYKGWLYVGRQDGELYFWHRAGKKNKGLALKQADSGLLKWCIGLNDIIPSVAEAVGDELERRLNK